MPIIKSIKTDPPKPLELDPLEVLASKVEKRIPLSVMIKAATKNREWTGDPTYGHNRPFFDWQVIHVSTLRELIRNLLKTGALS